jgi:hypothetical protein
VGDGAVFLDFTGMLVKAGLGVDVRGRLAKYSLLCHWGFSCFLFLPSEFQSI